MTVPFPLLRPFGMKIQPRQVYESAPLRPVGQRSTAVLVPQPPPRFAPEAALWGDHCLRIREGGEDGGGSGLALLLPKRSGLRAGRPGIGSNLTGRGCRLDVLAELDPTIAEEQVSCVGRLLEVPG